MNSVSIKDARENLAQLVDGAMHGTTTIITRRGKKVAILAPVASGKKQPMPDLAEFRQSLGVKGKPLSCVVAEQRRRSRY